MTHQRLRLCFVASVSLIAAAANAGGYKIPENSVKSTALSAAYVANAHGADAAYHNPAAMVFNEDRSLLEGNLTYIHLSEIDFDGNVTSALIGGSSGPIAESSEDQNFLIPSFHYSSPAVGNARFGLSVIVPTGLTKRWKSPVARSFAEKFSLETVEINPSAAYKLNESFAAALGLRAIYTEGTVRSKNPTSTAIRDMDGDSWDYGYNLAFLYKATPELDIALTYRSNIDLDIEGNARLTVGALSYSGFASVSVPVPAATALAFAYDVSPATTLEFVFERTEWSEYNQLDFNYNNTIHPVVEGVFGTPIAKDWDDTNTFRMGLTHQYDNQWIIMAGYAYDETPAPESTVGFDLPDSDAHIFSLGSRYKMDKDTTIGGALLYDYKESRNVDNDSIDGKFTDAAALLLTVGVEVAL